MKCLGRLVSVLLVMVYGFCAGLTGCFRVEEGREQTEPGVVVSRKYVPESWYPVVSTDAEGHTSVSIETDPEEYRVSLRCTHGTFRLNPYHENAENVYKRFREGDSITIHYTELWRVYRDTTKAKKFHDYNFLYADRRSGWEKAR